MAFTTTRWLRDPGEIARRVDVKELSGFFKKEVIIEPGCKAMMIVNGKHVGTLPSGKYDLNRAQGLLSMFDPGSSATAILVDESDIAMDFEISGLYTSDPLKVDIDLRIVFNLVDPVLFFTNVMKGSSTYLLSDFGERLQWELTNSLTDKVKGIPFSELSVSREALNSLGLDIESHLKTTLKREGFNIVQVRAIDIRQEGAKWILDTRSQINEEMGIIRAKNEQLNIQRAEIENYLEATEVIFQKVRAEKGRELETDRVELEHSRARLEIWDKLREGKNLDQMSTLTRDDEWEAFQKGVDEKKLLRDVEWKALQDTVKEKEEDRVAARQHLLKKIQLEREQEFKKLQQQYRYEIDKADRVEELTKLQDDLALESTLKESERNQLELDVIGKINRQLKEDDAALTIAKKKAETEAEIAEIDEKKDRIEIDMDRYEAEQGIKTLAQMKAVKREDKEEQARIEREDWGFRENMKHQQEIEKTELLAKLGPAALISASGPEQAKLLADLQKSEVLKGMDQDAILAMAAKDSPQVAEAIAEMYRSRSSDDTIKLYEQMLERSDKMADKVEQAQREGAERAERMFDTGMDAKTKTTEDKIKQTERDTERVEKITDKAMDKMGDTAVAKAGATDTSSGKVCPKCRTQNSLGGNFCIECGYEFK